MLKRYKEKMEKYKKKIIEYKDQVASRFKEIRDFAKKNEDDRNAHDKSMHVLQNKLQEQKEQSDHRVVQIQEENHKKMVITKRCFG